MSVDSSFGNATVLSGDDKSSVYIAKVTEDRDISSLSSHVMGRHTYYNQGLGKSYDCTPLFVQ